MAGKRQRKKLDGVVVRQKCSAHTSAGNPCQAAPIVGGSVCWHHGGAAPQVRAKANERLLKGVPTMLTELRRIAVDESMPAPSRVAAIKDWLDRAGIGENAKHEVTINLPKWQQNLEDLVVEVEDIVDAEVVEDDAYANANYPENAPGDTSRPAATPRRDPDAPPSYSRPTP